VLSDVQSKELSDAKEKYLSNARYWGTSALTRMGLRAWAIAAELEDRPQEHYELDMFDESWFVLVANLALRRCHVQAAPVKLARIPTEILAAERPVSMFELPSTEADVAGFRSDPGRVDDPLLVQQPPV
jgi:hypothetical protein